MTPKEKAKELTDKYFDWYGDDFYFSYESAKQCALITVEEIITISCGNWDLGNGKFDVVQYWEQVKNEIEKL